MRLALFAAAVLLVACGEQSAIQPSPVAQKPGPLGDTWTWNGTSWNRPDAKGPSPRYGASVAFDAARNVFVLFGGQTRLGPSDETWVWNGSRWKLLSPAHKPGARRLGSMAYDPIQHVVVLYSGFVNVGEEGGYAGDTWTWDGSDWTAADKGPGPPGMLEGVNVVTEGDRLVLFGGYFPNYIYSNDVFTWTGKTWTPIAAEAKPPGRGNAAVAWNPTDSTLFVYGGSGFNAGAGPGAQGTPLSDGWSLASGKWSRLGTGPGKLAFANGLWDKSGGRFVVMLGMPCPNPSGAAWAWDGKSWTQMAKPGISARWGAVLAQRPDGGALLFGGSNEKGC